QQVVRGLGWESLTFDPLNNPEMVMFGILIAGLWQGTGFVMCLMLAGLRGIHDEIWKATRDDGIPKRRVNIFIVIPMMRPVFITTLVIVASGIVRLYDLVVAQTSGGPGMASQVPAMYVYDYMFQAQNLGQGFAASTMMLLSVLIVLIPWAYLEFGKRKYGCCRPHLREGRAAPTLRKAGNGDGNGHILRPARAEAAEENLAAQHLPLRHAHRCRGLLSAASLRDGRHLVEGHAGDPDGQHL